MSTTSTKACEETWQTVVFGGVDYQISNLGKFRSLDRSYFRSDTGKEVLVKGRVLKATANRYGYLIIRISVNKEKFTVRIHRLVAEIFVDNLNAVHFTQVNHKDGNKENNHYSNLEWVDNSYNQIHALNTGLKQIHSGRKAVRLQFTTFAICVDKAEIVAIMNGNEEMAANGFDYRLVSAVVKGKRKSHNGCYFLRIQHN